MIILWHLPGVILIAYWHEDFGSIFEYIGTTPDRPDSDRKSIPRR
jgi:hypothetical protein